MMCGSLILSVCAVLTLNLNVRSGGGLSSARTATRLPESGGAISGARYEHQSNHQILPGFRATVRAVRDREAIPIAERKERLVSILGNVAELTAERMEELAPHATLRDAGMAAGVATDKLARVSSG